MAQKKREVQQENLLIAIDQLEQMMEVMGGVLGKIKNQATLLESNAPPSATEKNIAKKSTVKTKKVSIVH